MPLTEIEAHLIDALKMDGVRKGAAMAVCLMLKEEPQRMDMIEYLLEICIAAAEAREIELDHTVPADVNDTCHRIIHSQIRTPAL